MSSLRTADRGLDVVVVTSGIAVSPFVAVSPQAASGRTMATRVAVRVRVRLRDRGDGRATRPASVGLGLEGSRGGRRIGSRWVVLTFSSFASVEYVLPFLYSL
jgi:hypothetical protein